MTRSTFAAELLSAGEAIDQGMLLSHMLKELQSGPLLAHAARAFCDQGGLVPTRLYIDARSVYASVAASCIRAPSDKSLLSHMLHLRELIDNKVLTALAWIDTRDMLADGLTKGAVDRAALHQLMDGHMLLSHERAMYTSRAPVTIAGSSLDLHLVVPASPACRTQTAVFHC